MTEPDQIRPPEVLVREIMRELEVAVGEFAAIAEALDNQ